MNFWPSKRFLPREFAEAAALPPRLEGVDQEERDHHAVASASALRLTELMASAIHARGWMVLDA